MLDAIDPEERFSLDTILNSVQVKLDVPIVHATLIGKRQQDIVAGAGSMAARPHQLTLPLPYAICRHTVAMQAPLVIDDAYTHPLIKNELAVTELGVAAYLGAPVRYKRSDQLGAICAMDVRFRLWTKQEIAIVLKAADDINQLHS